MPANPPSPPKPKPSTPPKSTTPPKKQFPGGGWGALAPSKPASGKTPAKTPPKTAPKTSPKTTAKPATGAAALKALNSGLTDALVKKGLRPGTKEFQAAREKQNYDLIAYAMKKAAAHAAAGRRGAG